MTVEVTLTPSESKRLIARGVKALPSVQHALKNNTIILAGGTTNAFIAEELLGSSFPKKSVYTLGMIRDGKLSSSDEASRIFPYVIKKGKKEPEQNHWKEYLPKLVSGDIFIKGGNAIDHTGLAAILAGNDMGGTIGAAFGPVMQRGVELIVPIGLEKLVPDVRAAVEFTAGQHAEDSIGEQVGLLPVMGATIVTEITALETLYDVRCMCIAAGGTDGSEGSIVLAAKGEPEDTKRLMAEVRSIKGEPPVR
ncbi:hypothetical protein INP51_08360 [Blautia liquoris]|uniref:Uncharacterized protein n=1 Tax=Blautia liquoris TaxID=2779518 RepID=A0A7M2RFG5_9FIRM|nr:hypothetical protein [Blautia liquoris]QOV18070.1 hypothetical protein INP51_08360 [Blautia liquoris]